MRITVSSIFVCHDDFEQAYVQRRHCELDVYFVVRLCRPVHLLASLVRRQSKCVSILSCQSPTYLLLGAFIKVTNDLVTFHGEGNVALCVFQRCYVLRIGRMEQWAASTLDQIFVKEDRFYLDAHESGSIPDTDTLSLNYLPDVILYSKMMVPEPIN